jgi:hypothetical protein
MPRLTLAVSLLAGCPSPGPSPDDPCTDAVPVEVTLGTGVGGTFVPIGDGQEVGLSTAPQGGFGVTVLIRTRGLVASDSALADIQLDTEIDGANAGTFLQEDVPLLCTEGEGGTVFGVVVGFDASRYKTNDDLLSLDGETVDLVVTVSDESGESGMVRQPVTIVVGG